jgi:uncharacterized protein DUF6298/collagenase-like protein with putative collagen-binding domain
VTLVLQTSEEKNTGWKAIHSSLISRFIGGYASGSRCAPRPQLWKGSRNRRISRFCRDRWKFSYAVLAISVLALGLWSFKDQPATHQSVTPLNPASGPLRRHPTNPRYFADASGKAVYLTGSHTWENFQDNLGKDQLFDYRHYLDYLQRFNHNLTRLWVSETALGDGVVPRAPMPYQRTGPGTAEDGQPKFDVTQFNQLYFDRLRDRVIAAGEQGIYVMVMLFQGFSIEPKGTYVANSWTGHPLNARNNVNGIDGDSNRNGSGEEVHTLGNPIITAQQETYVRKVIDTLNDLDNVLYEISNESHESSVQWQYHFINFIQEFEQGKPKQHPTVMTFLLDPGRPTGKEDAELFSSPADAVSPGPGRNHEYKSDPPPADGAKVIISDTDHLWGVGGDQAWVWKSYLRGHNPIFMDPYEGPDQKWDRARENMGHTLRYARRVDMAAMVPLGNLASTGYCLASQGSNYLVYLPQGGTVTLDLSAASGLLTAEWFNPTTGYAFQGGSVLGGSVQTFESRFDSRFFRIRLHYWFAERFQIAEPDAGRDAVLFISASESPGS